MIINVPKLMETFEENGLTNVWVDDTGRITHENATAQQLALAEQLRDTHNPAELSGRQAGIAQLTTFLDNHLSDLKYGDYFYRLYIRMVHADLWADKPNLTATTTIIVTALHGGKATTAEMTDVNHIQMYNVFLWYVQRTAGIVLVSGDLPAAPTAVQAQAINQAAYIFALSGVTMMNMLLLNQRF